MAERRKNMVHDKWSARFWIFILCCGFFMLLLAPPGAFAQDSVTGLGIEVHATFHNVGIQVTVSGDDNSNAAAHLEVSVGGGNFAAAHDLSRADAGRFVGSAFLLPQDTGFGVRVTLEDPDGATNGVLAADGRTRSTTPPEAAIETLHVSTAGDDSSGTGEAVNPFRSVGRALDEAAPGTLVLVHGGEYHESLELTAGGTPGFPLVIRAAGDGPAVLTGFDPALSDPAAWNDEGGGVYSAAADPTGYVAAGGVRLWMYESLADLRTRPLGLNGGFFHDGTRLYVALPDGASPAATTVQVSTMGRAFWLEGASDVVIDGLVIRGYGSEQYSEGIMVRDGADDVWITGCIFENDMPGIWVKGAVDDLAVMGSEFSDVGLAGFPWDAVKNQGGMESGAINLDSEYDGQGIVFQGNTVHDSFDGLHICGDRHLDHPNNADVIANRIYRYGDDGMETDGECSNVRIIGNRFETGLCGVSLAPAVTGPVSEIRTLVVDLRNEAPGSDWMTRAFKFNVGDDRPSGNIFIYHNTASTTEEAQSAFAVTDDSTWTSVLMLNNIWVGTEYGFYYSNTGDEPFHHDYDLIYTTDATRLVFYQDGRYTTIPDYFSATGQCEHCLSADPLFADLPSGDYELQEASPAVDTATAIPGVNDTFEGGGPDIGALERGGGSIIPVPDAPSEAFPDVPEQRPDRAPDATVTDVPAGDGETGEEGEGGGGGCGCAILE
jgi:hypothetical protein